MPLIRGRRIPLALEHMAQMPAAVATHDLRALHPKRTVGMSRHGPRQGIKVRGPSAPGLELVGRLVEGRIAPRAVVDPLRREVLVVFARAGPFGALFAEDAELFLMQKKGHYCFEEGQKREMFRLGTLEGTGS